MTTTDILKKTPLYENHLSLNARMVPFGGWNMPVQYEGILAEYKATREQAAIFDISHMGEFIIEGDCVASGLDRIVTMSLKDLPVHSSRYGLILNEQGGAIDDLIVFRMEEKKWFIVVNAATIEKDAAHFCANLKDKKVFSDISARTGKIDIQGPRSREIMKKLVASIEKLNYFTFDFFDLLGENVLISRTGYTGELGYEIFYPSDKIARLWEVLLEFDDVKPAGLGARDVLRLEAGYSLYGHELDETISPLEAGLSRFIDFEKEFIGKDVLLKQKQEGLKRKIVGLISQTRRSPRAEYKIYNVDQREIGQITSGTFSPSLNKGIGLGFVDCAAGEKGANVFFGDDKAKIQAVIAGRIFYKNSSIKS